MVDPELCGLRRREDTTWSQAALTEIDQQANCQTGVVQIRDHLPQVLLVHRGEGLDLDNDFALDDEIRNVVAEQPPLVDTLPPYNLALAADARPWLRQ